MWKQKTYSQKAEGLKAKANKTLRERFLNGSFTKKNK